MLEVDSESLGLGGEVLMLETERMWLCREGIRSLLILSLEWFRNSTFCFEIFGK